MVASSPLSVVASSPASVVVSLLLSVVVLSFVLVVASGDVSAPPDVAFVLALGAQPATNAATRKVVAFLVAALVVGCAPKASTGATSGGR